MEARGTKRGEAWLIKFRDGSKVWKTDDDIEARLTVMEADHEDALLAGFERVDAMPIEGAFGL